MNHSHRLSITDVRALPDRPGSRPFPIARVLAPVAANAVPEQGPEHVQDELAIEEPLEIRIEHGPRARRVRQSLSITMRTPGYDFELAAGFLFTEAIIHDRHAVESIGYCGPDLATTPLTNIVRVELDPRVELDLGRLTRHFYTTSSCGVCGKSSIEALRVQSRYSPAASPARADADLIHRLPDLLRKAQGIFDVTGGLHASALFSERGEMLGVREDVGRHNALDKLIGDAFLRGRLPLGRALLLVSGRASFELVQKAAMAGIGVFAAVGAPSSLAVELARDTGMTLLGFVRGGRFNIYANGERVRCPSENTPKNPPQNPPQNPRQNPEEFPR